MGVGRQPAASVSLWKLGRSAAGGGEEEYAPDEHQSCSSRFIGWIACQDRSTKLFILKTDMMVEKTGRNLKEGKHGNTNLPVPNVNLSDS